MKLARITASGAGLALVAASVFVGAAAASAADFDVVLPNPVPAETGPYAAGWFAGTVTGTASVVAQTPAGVGITAGTSGYVLLNGDPANNPSSISLTAALESAQVSSTGADAFFQIAVYGEPGATEQEFTSLRPINADNTSGDWTVSQGVPSLSLVAGTSYTKAVLIAAFDGGPTKAKVLAFGVFVNAGTTSTVRGIDFGENTYFFAPRASVTVNPTSLTVADLVKPVTITASGFAAGETVSFGLGSATSGDVLGTAIAGENGTAVYSYTFVPGSPVGDYTFFARDEFMVFIGTASFSVVSNVLPATGLDATGTLLAGGVLLLAGAGIALVTLRRKSAQA
jgi:hypothetical protein